MDTVLDPKFSLPSAVFFSIVLLKRTFYTVCILVDEELGFCLGNFNLLLSLPAFCRYSGNVFIPFSTTDLVFLSWNL